MRAVVPVLVVATVAAGVAFVLTSGDDDGPTDAPDASDANGPAVDEVPFDGGMLPDSIRLLDTRAGSVTVDGEQQATGPLDPGSPLDVPVAGRGGVASQPGLVVLSATVIAADTDGEISVSPCGSPAEPVRSVRAAAGATTTRQLLVPVGSNGSVCVDATVAVDVALDLEGTVDPAAVRPIASPVRLLDTRADGETDDGRLRGIGVRAEGSTIRLPVSERFSGLDDVGALMVSVTAADPLDDGELAAFAPEAATPSATLVDYTAGASARSVEIVPIGESGELCVSTSGRTDLVVDVLGVLPASAEYPVLPAPTAAPECPGQQLFPNHRIVALYGTQRSERLGVLGEQSPADAVARVEEIAAPWRAGETPVLPAFELIATLATSTPEDRGDFNIRAEPAFVQEYLDVARRNGYYLILDLQVGQSDFLTEAKYYEEFLRQPDVGLALDPEWRTEPPARPRGGYVGQVDAAEVNQVIDYLAELVEEEGLPEKLLVVHQFQDRMITNRSQIVERPGVALTIHMDGFGTRAEKLNSWRVVLADPPWNMGLKLFFDEDIEMFLAPEVLDGAFEPIPDMITYQ